MSARLFSQAEQVLVGGVNSPVRSFKGVGGTPLIIDKGRKQRIIDADGKVYTDYCLAWGALILGHAFPPVVTSARTSISLGSTFGTTTRPEVDIARLIVKNVPSIDLVRFVNSGTEATMSAVRLARGFTKRPMIVKFDGCYHGHFDDFLHAAGSGVASLSGSSSQGIAQGRALNAVSLPYNDIRTAQAFIERNARHIACVIIEPVAGNMGVIVPDIEFLKTLRALTAKHGILLIFDEVMSGFRTNLGGAQADFKIIPDLTCLGKIIGGGYPVGAYGGRADIMRHLAPLGEVYQAGTFSGSPLVMRAGLETLKALTANVYKSLNTKSKHFTTGINAMFAAEGIPAHVSAYGSMVSIWTQRETVMNYEQARRASSGPVYAQIFHNLLKNGVYFPPANLETFFISVSHSTKDLSDIIKLMKGFFIKT